MELQYILNEQIQFKLDLKTSFIVRLDFNSCFIVCLLQIDEEEGNKLEANQRVA